MPDKKHISTVRSFSAHKHMGEHSGDAKMEATPTLSTQVSTTPLHSTYGTGTTALQSIKKNTNQNFNRAETQIGTKLILWQNSSCDKTQIVTKLMLGRNSKLNKKKLSFKGKEVNLMWNWNFEETEILSKFNVLQN